MVVQSTTDRQETNDKEEKYGREPVLLNSKNSKVELNMDKNSKPPKGSQML